MATEFNLNQLVRFQVLTAASMMFRAVFWVILPCRMMVDNHSTRQYNPEDSSEQLNQLFGKLPVYAQILKQQFL
jgi:hypothetical protein